jgi:hypothetical protein
LCCRNELYEEEYVEIDTVLGKMLTGNDAIDFEKIEKIYYTVVATDGKWKTNISVSTTSLSLEGHRILRRCKQKRVIIGILN